MADVRIGDPRTYTGGDGSTSVTPSRQGSSTIRGPRDIMRARDERDAKKKEEEERKERERRAALQRSSASGDTGAAVGGVPVSSTRGRSGPVLKDISDNSQTENRDRTSGTGIAHPAVDHLANVRRAAPDAQPARSSRQQAQNIPPGDGADDARSEARSKTATASAFPQAFERWETLSAHWEGLTSFWLRRIQTNSEDIQGDPISRQLSRQVSDLSAAGANLFHAVVELQRLRASSERKFQRWFMETREEQERTQEITRALEAQLQQERGLRAQDVDQHAQEGSVAEIMELRKQVAEAKRELIISRDESRRAWEELGRREQDEHERQNSLRQGHPTVVCGITVVPRMDNAPIRRGSVDEGLQAGQLYDDRPQAREGPYPGGPGPNIMGGQELMEQYSHDPTGSNTTDPYASTVPASAIHPAYLPSQHASGGYYRPSVVGSSGTSSDPLRAQAYIGDLSRQRLNPQSQAYHEQREREEHDSDEDFDATADRAREIVQRQAYDFGPSSSELGTIQQGEEVESYPPASYSSDEVWQTVPRQHGVRLSDVMEEDERSRTTASQMSRRD